MANQVLYGFQGIANLFPQLASGVSAETLDDAITASVDEHNRQMAAIMSAFVRRVDPLKYKTTFTAPGLARNQPLTEDGRPNPIMGGASYEVAFPLQMSGQAIAYTYVAYQKATVEKVNADVRTALLGDQRWVWDHILGAIFANATYPWWSKETGDLTIQPLANGDGTTYHVMGGGDVGADDNHFLAQAAAILDASNPYPAIYQDLNEHPENDGAQIVAFIPTGLKGATMLLDSFHPIADENIQRGSGSDVFTGTLSGSYPGTLIGYDDSGTYIVEYSRLPAGYIVSLAMGGEPPIGQREDAETALQGFADVPAANDPTPFPHLRRTWLRRSGFGGWNRVGGLVYRIGDAAYAVPTGFAVPMP